MLSQGYGDVYNARLDNPSGFGLTQKKEAA
jgi:hypothetical protein